MVGNFTFAQQKALTEKEKLAKELQVVKASDLQDVVPGVVSKFNYDKPVYSNVDFSKKGSRGMLYDNGPFVTHVGGGPGGSDYSLLQNPPNTTLGFGYNQAGAIYVADDFTATEDWAIDSLVFFGYQTGSTLTSTFTGIFVEIWNGDPGVAGSAVVWGDLTTNLIVDTYWTNCYRGSDLIATNRPIMGVVAGTSGLNLPAGDYWVVFAATGSTTSGPWCPPITILDQPETGNAMQSLSGVWAPLIDAGSLGAKGLPFIIHGNAGVNPDIIYATDFESFVAGTQVACQDPVNWSTWSNAPCGAEDGMVSTDFAHTAVNSVKINGTNDLLLLLGDKTAGSYELSWWMYVENGKAGYYNLQKTEVAGQEFGYEAYFLANGNGTLSAGATNAFTFTYPKATWFKVVQMLDVDNDLVTLYINEVMVAEWPLHYQASSQTGMTSIGAIDFYAGAVTGETPQYYFDDVEYKDASAPPVVLNPPRNLAGIAVGQNVHLTWDAPVSGNQFFEGFEGGTLPTGWLAIDHDGDGYNWINTIEQGFGFTAHTGDGAMASASYDNTAGALTPDNWLITPPIAISASSQLIYWHSAQDALWADEHYYVKISTTTPDLTSFTNTVFDGVTPADWEEVTIDLAAYAGQTIYIAFQHCEVTDMFWMKLDDISVTGTATRAAVTEKITPPQVQGFGFKTAGLTPEQIAAKQLAFVSPKATRALLGYNVYRDGAIISPAVVTDLFYDDANVTPGTYEYTVTALYSEGESVPAGPVEVTVQPGGLIIVNIGEGTELPSSPKTPLDFYWMNSLAESLYFPEEIGQPAGTQITQIAYYNSFTSGIVGTPVKIFMGETTDSDLTGGWISANDLVTVFDGVVDFPSGTNDIVITLQTPYTYNGDNLVIMTNRPMDTQYYLSADKFFSTTSTDHPARTLAVYSDGTLFDPYAPPTGTLTKDYFPNTTLYMIGGGPSSLYATDFESFTLGGQVACQDPVNWTTWSNAPCSPTEDAYISNDFAHSPVLSAKVDVNNDLVLLMGNKTSGKYELNFDIYVPAGYCGYYNILQDFAGASSVWGMQLYLHTDGTASLDAGGVGAATFNYNHDQWIPIKNIIDLDSDLAELIVDGVSIYTWQWTLGALGAGGPLQIGAADFFGGADANYPSDIPLYYFDDIDYKQASAPANPRIVVTPASFNVELEPNTTTTQTLNIANTGGAALDFIIDITYPVKSVRIINNNQKAERVIESIPVKGGKYSVQKNSYKLIPDVVNPANITKSTLFANKHVPAFSRANVYVNQTGNPSTFGGIASQDFTDLAAYACAGADDFEVPSGATWNVNHVFVGGTYSTGSQVPAVDVVFYADAAGIPGTALFTFEGVTAESETSGNVNVFLPSTATLSAGHYWVSVAAHMDYATYGQWYWSREADPLMLNEFVWQNPGGGFAGCTSWCYGSVQWPAQTDYNLAFALTDSTQAPPPTGWLAADPLTGSVPAGGNVNVEVTFDAAGLGVGTYNGLLSINSNDPAHPVKDVPAVLQVKVPGAMPLVEDWASGSFGTNDWTFDPAQSNWVINATYGNPAPSAAFNWSPAITNYSFALVSPMLNATAVTDNVTLKFDLELNNFATTTLEGMAVEVWDGSAWQMVQDYPNTNGSFPFTSEAFNITSLAAGHNFAVRFRAYGEDSFNINYWYLDNIKIYQQVVGNLTGTITKLSDGSPVQGAVITIENSLSGVYTATSGANGVYTIPGAEAGAYDLSVVKEGFNVIEDNVAIVGNETVTENYALTAPIIGVDPTSLAVTVGVGETTTRIVNVTNTGNGPLAWSGSIQSDKKIHVPASDGNFVRGTAPTSFGRAPVVNQPSGTPTLTELLRGTTGYAFDIYPGLNFFSFDTDAPGSPTVISPITIQPFGGTYDAVNSDFVWIIDYTDGYVKKVDVATGNVTSVGYAGMTSGHTPTGLTCDKTTNTLYGSSTNGSTSTIYTIDQVTGAATIVGNTSDPLLIDICVDGTGQMYGFDIGDDMSYLIDKATGASTVIGSIGYDANYAQGMGWDPISDNIYFAAYGTAGELRVFDRATGATALIGAFAGETDALAFTGGGGGNWASIDPASGTLAAGGTVPVTVTFDGSYVPPQKDLTVTGVLKFSTNPNVGSPEVDLSMTITGEFFGVLNGFVNQEGVAIPGVTVTATRQESPVYTYTMVTGADGMFNFPTTLYGTYDFTAEKTGYNPFISTTPAVVIGGQTTTFNIEMDAPVMVINPTSITASTPFGTVITRTITVQNTGDGTLEWFADSHEIPAPANIYATDFESFVAGTKVACQDPVNWTTWSNAPCGAEDGMVSTDYAFSAPNSAKIDGSNDLVLPMGNKTTGKYEFSFEMFIPAGHGGYYNILHDFQGATSEWGLEFYFEDAGTAQLHAGGQIAPIAYNHDQWFTVTNIIDLDNDLAEVFLDGVSVLSWQWSLDPSTGNPGTNMLSATDFYSGAGATGIVNPLYYFDNLVYKVADAVQKGIVSNGNFPRGTAAPSYGRAPVGTSAPSKPLGDLRGSLGYAFHVFASQDFFSFDSDDPNAQSVIASPVTETAMGGSFDGVNTDFYYIWDYNDGNLKTVDIATGAITTIGPCTPNGAQVMSGIACDKNTNIMYGIGTDVSVTDLYTIDMSTGAATTVGSTGIAGGIDCAIDATGAMWVFDIVTDEIYKVDLATGVGTDIGSAGFDGNYGQGMTYDYETDNVYLAAFNSGTFLTEWRVLDRTTGNTTLIADMGSVQVDGLGFPGGGGPQWLTIDPKTGIIPAGASAEVTVTLDGNYIPPQKDFTLFGEVTFTSDPDVGTINVPVTFTITGDFYGQCEGTITHMGVGVPNATVIAVKVGVAPYTATTDGSGHFLMPQVLGGTYDVSVTAAGYNPAFVTGVIVSPPNTTTVNVSLLAPVMVISPGSLTVNLMSGQTLDETLTVQNNGDGTLAWGAAVHVDAKQVVHVPASNGVFPRGTAPTSFGRAPAVSQPTGNETVTELLRGTMGYAFDIYPGLNFFSFDTDAPGSPTVISPITIQPFGGTYDAVNSDFVWIIDYADGYVKKVDVATGNVTSVGYAGMTSGHTPTGLTCDKITNTLYGSSTNGSTSTIYTIDQTTGAATIVGNTNNPLLIDICVDGTGQMYGFDIGDDMSYLIDKATGASTVIGSIGYDANYAQGMGWDPISDNIYFAAYGTSGELRVFDRTTGATALIGAFAGETDGLAFPGGGSPQWITIDPKLGIIPAGNTQPVNAHFDATDLADGTYTGNITFVSEPNVGTVVVPVTMVVGSIGGPTLTIGGVYDVPAGPVSVPVHALEIDNMGSFQFTIDYNPAYLTYTGTSNWYTGITDVLVGTPSAGKLTFVWAASTAGISIPDGNFFNIDFTFTGTTDWAWIGWSDSPTPREFADYMGNIFTPTYNNGFVTGHPVGVPENGALAINVYPNPATDIVNVKSDYNIKSIEVLSFIGQTVYTRKNVDSKLVQVDVSSLNSGVYFVKLDTDQGIKTTKITVKR